MDFGTVNQDFTAPHFLNEVDLSVIGNGAVKISKLLHGFKYRVVDGDVRQVGKAGLVQAGEELQSSLGWFLDQSLSEAGYDVRHGWLCVGNKSSIIGKQKFSNKVLIILVCPCRHLRLNKLP